MLENTGDMPIETEFIADKSSPEVNLMLLRNGRLLIEPNSRNILEGKMILNLPKSDDGKPLTVHKLLIGKIKECELKYSLIVEIYIV